MTYEGMPAGSNMAAMGTGWLIRPDTLVTAGHVVYDHSGDNGRGYGKLRTIQCYIGYNGRDSMKPGMEGASVQSRSGRNVVTTGEWIGSRDNRHRDVAFIQLDRPFTGDLRLFSFASTPMSSNEVIGVVGYPQDMQPSDEFGDYEPGAQMHELFKQTMFDRKDSALNMLEYKISTYGGQSSNRLLSTFLHFLLRSYELI
jgi:V8-like Glu-specific endopeptidase